MEEVTSPSCWLTLRFNVLVLPAEVLAAPVLLVPLVSGLGEMLRFVPEALIGQYLRCLLRLGQRVLPPPVRDEGL